MSDMVEVRTEDRDISELVCWVATWLGAGLSYEQLDTVRPELETLYNVLGGFVDEKVEQMRRDQLAQPYTVVSLVRRGDAEGRREPSSMFMWSKIKDKYREGKIDAGWPLWGGVYVLYDENDVVLYVGKAKCGAQRLRDHANAYDKRTAGYSRWRLWRIDDEDTRCRVERYLINLLDPSLNVQRPSKKS